MASVVMDQLMADIKEAMITKNSEALLALRTLHAAIKDQTVNAGIDVTDEVVCSVVTKAIKQRNDAIEQFTAASRQDLVDTEQKQINLYRKYQPQQLDRAEIEVIVRQCIAESGVTTKKEMGKVMALLMPKVKGRSDGKLVNQVVQSLLT
ncbi:MAG: GatB/YqeY domain-containing protein [bacterium]